MRRPHRPGYVLPYILLVIALVAVVAAVAAPTVAGVADRARVRQTATRLRSVRSGVQSFVTGVGHYPGTVSQLSIPITSASKNSCGQPMTTVAGGDVPNWSAKGPYTTQYADVDGPWTPLGRIKNAIPVRPASGKNALYIDMDGVNFNDAAGLHAYVDGSTGDTVTTLHAPVNDTTTVRYRALSAALAINNGC